MGTLLAYAGGGVISGCILGLLRPLTRWRAGAALVGIAVALPAFFGIALAMSGLPQTWDDSIWASTVGCSVLLGGWFGADTWSRNRKRGQEPPA